MFRGSLVQHGGRIRNASRICVIHNRALLSDLEKLELRSLDTLMRRIRG
jgi:hypothetical protein